MNRIIITAIITILCFAVSAFATVINIPADYLTIQEGIDASSDGDTVLVQPGTYVENISFCACDIVVGSLFLTTGEIEYIYSTIIDGDSAGSVITFQSIGDRSVLTGFTIQNGSEGGISCLDSWSVIRSNIIKDNIGYMGGGILTANSLNIIENNIIMNNNAVYGGAINCMWYGNSIIANNVIINNQASEGIIYIYGSSPDIYHNIIWDINIPPIVVYSSSYPTILYNNIQGGWEGEGNIDSDPLFRDPENGDFHLMSTECGDPYDSPCIDTGSPAIIDSLLDCDWGLGTILSDMGAYGGGDSVMVAIEDYIKNLPEKFALFQNYPNPFNPTTTIRYSLPTQSDVRIEIYNIIGQRVATLFDGNKQAGYHAVTWQADDYPSGVYFARLETGKRSENIKVVLIK